MEEYYFLFVLALIYTAIASLQDLKRNEVPNWVNFSFLIFALAYRAIYAVTYEDYTFFLYGLTGAVFLFLIANIFFYSKVFAGADAKMLMAFGAILPYSSLASVILISLIFVFALFFIGTIYTLFYSLKIAYRNKDNFTKELYLESKKSKWIWLVGIFLFIIVLAEYIYLPIKNSSFLVLGIVMLLSPILYIYLKAIEKSSMIRLVSGKELTEGDWLDKRVTIGNRVINTNASGLSVEEIKLIRKSNKKVWIKYGIPFIPAFFLTTLVMVLFFLFYRADLSYLLELF